MLVNYVAQYERLILLFSNWNHLTLDSVWEKSPLPYVVPVIPWCALCVCWKVKDTLQILNWMSSKSKVLSWDFMVMESMMSMCIFSKENMLSTFESLRRTITPSFSRFFANCTASYSLKIFCDVSMKMPFFCWSSEMRARPVNLNYGNVIVSPARILLTRVFLLILRIME